MHAPEQIAFYLCPHAGCKRKYRRDQQWIKHQESAHGQKDAMVPDPVMMVPKRARKRKKSGVEPQAKPKKQKKEKDVAEDQECKICWEARATTAVVPCGHASFCFSCIDAYHKADASHVCPVCRGPITSIMKLYQ